MKIYIASDHGGFLLKSYLIEKLKERGFETIDAGPEKYNPEDDYPTEVISAIKAVQEDSQNRGVLICRNGVGVSVFANRFKGIRAGLSWNVKHVRTQRIDDDTNILTLPNDYISKGKALKITLAWLETETSQEERHRRRRGLIEELS